MPNEQEQFLKSLEVEENQDPFATIEGNAPIEQPSAEKDDNDELDMGLKPKNRRERRLAEKYQAEREANIAMAARLDAITEIQKERTSEAADYLQSVERIYGTDSPEAREATEILKGAILAAKEAAKAEVLEAIREEREIETRAVVEAENTLDSMIEELEDEFGVDIEGSKTHLTGFLNLLERMSPKDREGNIIQYADHFAVWEEYQDRLSRKAQANPAKDLASRSMTQSGAPAESNLTQDVTERYLREHGII